MNSAKQKWLAQESRQSIEKWYCQAEPSFATLKNQLGQ
jgi:hypothetical protein